MKYFRKKVRPVGKYEKNVHFQWAAVKAELQKYVTVIF